MHTDLDSSNFYGWNHRHRYGYQVNDIRYLAAPIPDSYFTECRESNLYSVAKMSWIDSLDRK